MSQGAYSPQGRLVVLLVILVTFCHKLYAYIPPHISHMMRIRSPIILQQRSITSTTWNQRDKQFGRLWSTTDEDNTVDKNNDVIKGEETSPMITQIESNSGNTEMPAIVRKAIQYLQVIATIVSESPIWRKYSNSLSIKPVLTKSFSSMLGFLVGDLLAQMITRKTVFNVPRWIRMGSFGAVIHGPSGHFVYGFLERTFPGPSKSAVIKKVIVDQAFWSPIFSFSLFCFTGVTAGLSPREIFGLLKRNGLFVLLSSWLIWPAAHAINFGVVPSKHRLLYINGVQVLFNTILSLLVNV